MAHKHDCVTLVTSFITWVIERIKLVHRFYHTKPPPEPIEGSYYPPRGTAYYFTETENNSESCQNMIVMQDSTSTPIMMSQMLWIGNATRISLLSAWEVVAICFYDSVANMGIVLGST